MNNFSHENPISVRLVETKPVETLVIDIDAFIRNVSPNGCLKKLTFEFHDAEYSFDRDQLKKVLQALEAYGTN